MPLFGPPNVDKLKAKHNVKGLIKALGHEKDWQIRRDAAKALGQIWAPAAVMELAVGPLIALLKDKEESVRQAAVKALGQIGAPAVEPLIAAQAVEPLIAALEHEDWQVRRDVAGALRQIGDERAVEPLINALTDEEWPVRWRAAEALRQIGDERAVESLIAALKDCQFNVRREAAGALGQIGDERAAEPLVAVLADKEGDVRQVAVSALRQIGAPAVEPLIVALKDGRGCGVADEVLDMLGWQPDRSEAGAAYWVARREWDKCVEIGALAVGPLIAALKATDAAVEALVRIGTPTVERLIAALKDENWDVRRRAAEGLGQIGDARAVGPLLAALDDDDLTELWSTVEYVRMAAAEALGQIGDERAVEPLLAALESKNCAMRRRAAEALGQIGDERAVQPLINMHKDWDVCEAAAEALGKIGVPAVELLLAALEDEDAGVRRFAAKVLGQISDERAVQPLVNALKNVEMRWAAIEALEAIGWVPTHDENGAIYYATKEDWDKCVEIGAPAVEPLIAVLENWYRGLGAAEALGAIGWEPTHDENGALYWMAKGEWDRCVEIGAPAVELLVDALKYDVRHSAAGTLALIGAPAVESLIATLKSERWEVRNAAARALVTIYRTAQRDSALWHRILNQQSVITEPHISKHTDFDNSSCGHNDYHRDTGIGGVDFPL